MKIESIEIAELSGTNIRIISWIDNDGRKSIEFEIDNSVLLEPSLGDSLTRQVFEHGYKAGYEAARNQVHHNDIKSILSMVNEQAEDCGLWFVTRHIQEAYLQQHLRALHERIEIAFGHLNPAQVK